MRHVVLIDGMNTAFRMHYPHRYLKTTDGHPTSVIYGVLKLIRDFYMRLGPVELVFVWEGAALGLSKEDKSWRKKLQTNYKAHRKPSPELPLILKQLPLVVKALKTLKIPVLGVPGLEADDLIGIASAHYSNNNDVESISVLSSDKDFYQLLDDPKIHVLSGQIKYTKKMVIDEFGVEPHLWAEYRALCGDASDNIRGAYSIGPVKARRLIGDGVRPSVAAFEDLPKSVQVAYQELAPAWPAIHQCYVLSFMPRSYSYKYLERPLQLAARAAIKELPKRSAIKVPKNEYDKILRFWTGFCSDYQLSSFLEDRRRFLQHLQII